LALDLVAYWSAMCRRQYSNLFVDELRGSGGGGGAFVACCRPSSGCYGVSPCAYLGGAVLLAESPVNRGLDDLARGDGHSIELTEARNQSWKP